MKILFFSNAYPNPANPGQGTFNRTMIAGLAAEHEIRVVSPVSFADIAKAFVKGRLPRGLNDPQYQAIPGVPALYCPWYYTPKFYRDRYGQFMRLSVRSKLDRVMKEFEPEIVLSYWTHPDGEVAVDTAHRFGIRAVTIVGGSDVLINARAGSRRNTILNVLNRADGVVAVSEDIKRILIADGIDQNKLLVARRGTDRRVFHEGSQSMARRRLNLPDNRPIVINVGRLVDVKGHSHLLDACQIMSERGTPFRCYILGDGPLRSTLQSQIEQLGLNDSVELRGAQTTTELAEWYRAANLSVLASLSEGVPNVLLESIACGTPFVASNVGGISEIADPSLDTLVPAANSTALAEAIIRHLETPTDGIRQVRSYQPPSMSESAEYLSRILRSVQTGRPLDGEPCGIMHETTFDRDVQNEDSNHKSPSSADNDPAVASPSAEKHGGESSHHEIEHRHEEEQLEFLHEMMFDRETADNKRIITSNKAKGKSIVVEQ